MTFGTVLHRRLFAAGSMAALMLAVLSPAATFATSHDPQLLATLELTDGDIDHELELGTLHIFNKENAPFAVQVIDGCAVNDSLWLFGAGLSGVPMPLTVMDLNTGKSERISLPPFEPGVPIGTVLDPEALSLCGDAPLGGLPTLDGTATYTSANARGEDGAYPAELASEGRDDAYRRLAIAGSTYPIISKGSPIVAIDEDATSDTLYLITESLTPRRLEGVVFRGDEGMLPSRAKLAKGLAGITNGRVRRAYQTAKNGRVPQRIIDDLKLSGIDRAFHVGLEFDTLGAAAYLASAGWIKDGGAPLKPPPLVEARFKVELVRANGEATELPLLGPLVGSDAEGLLWQYGNEGALVQVMDACDLSGSFWTVAGALTEEPLELIVTDTDKGISASHLLWTDRRDLSHMSDSSALASCP